MSVEDAICRPLLYHANTVIGSLVQTHEWANLAQNHLSIDHLKFLEILSAEESHFYQRLILHS